MWFDKGVNNPECDVHDVQSLAVQLAQDGDVMVEVGTFLGESLHCLIDKVAAAKKDVKIFAVDNFDLEFMNREDTENFDLDTKPVMASEKEQGLLKHGHKGMLVEFYNKLREAGKEKYLKGCLVGKSWDFASCFADQSIRFCFIDAGHSYNAVKLDLEAWYPKMKPQSVFAGHDWYAGEGVRRAVIEFAVAHNLKIQLFQSSWRITS